MHIGYLGLGKMGKNMVLRLLEHGVEVTAWNRSEAPRLEVKKAGAQTTDSIKSLISTLKSPRTLWLMLPAGDITETAIQEILPLLSPGDTVIDGGNAFYKDSIRRGELLAQKQINFIDVGVSGGPGGARNGACLMIGGQDKVFKQLEPLFKVIAAPDSYAFFEGFGAGHFVKMVHNGIEYGMMQAIAEGFAVMKASKYNLDLSKVAELYNHGSVIESKLIGWTQSGFEAFGQELEPVSTTIAHSGEGEWTVLTAKELQVPVPIIEGSFQFRVKSNENPAYTNKVVSMIRNQFGGHSISSGSDETSK